LLATESQPDPNIGRIPRCLVTVYYSPPVFSVIRRLKEHSGTTQSTALVPVQYTTSKEKSTDPSVLSNSMRLHVLQYRLGGISVHIGTNIDGYVFYLYGTFAVTDTTNRTL
jgi:hypothetical protein